PSRCACRFPPEPAASFRPAFMPRVSEQQRQGEPTLSWAVAANVEVLHEGASASLIYRANLNSSANSAGTGWSGTYDAPAATLGSKFSVQAHVSLGSASGRIPGLDSARVRRSSCRPASAWRCPFGALRSASNPFLGNTAYFPLPRSHPPDC